MGLWRQDCLPQEGCTSLIRRAAAELEPHVRLVKVDTEAAPDLAAYSTIRSISSLVLLHHGKEIARSAGRDAFARSTRSASGYPPKGAPYGRRQGVEVLAALPG